MGKGVAKQRDRLPEGGGALGLLGALEADRDRLVEAPGAEQVVGEVDGRRRFDLGEDLGGTGVDDPPPRGHGLAVDRLLGERVSPAVSPRVPGSLLDQLLVDRRLERRENRLLVLFGDAEERRILECAAQNRGRLQDRDLLGDRGARGAAGSNA